MTAERDISLGRWTAAISFVLGTGILGLYWLSSSFQLLFVGYGFIALAGLVNLGVLVFLLIKAIAHKGDRGKLLATCGVMLLNIPVLVVYCWIAMILTDTMRITFTNATPMEVTDIRIVGCEREHIDKLQPGESATVWVDITGDCSISVDYLANGVRKEEVVASYVTNGMGQRVPYAIGGTNEAVI